VTSLALSMFSCKRLGVWSSDLYLLADMSQQCYASLHEEMILVLTIPLVVLFVLGIPIVGFLLLFLNRHKIEYDNAAFKEKFGFLYNGYKIAFWYWEFIVVLRKMALVSVSVYFSESQNIQALMAVLLCTIALTVHSAGRPFVHTTLNVMEFLSLVSSFCTFFWGQFLFIEDIGNDVKITASAMVLFVNIGFVLLVVAVWVWWFVQKLDRLKAKAERKRVDKEDMKKVPWTEGDWRFNLQSGTTLADNEKEFEMHPSEAVVNDLIDPHFVSSSSARPTSASVVAGSAAAAAAASTPVPAAPS